MLAYIDFEKKIFAADLFQSSLPFNQGNISLTNDSDG